ncbi:MAG: Gfo/Idh/MocA family oxidoreductase [Fimbriimonadaceae bacterium]|nr:Gfo/Idh/MocA family oxidoreductase [Fimbriimonadaceae bacterium]
MAAIRAAVLGCGAMANRVHYPALADLPEIDVVACCDLDPARCRETAERWQIPAQFADYRQMVEQTAPDVVYAIGQPHQLYDAWVWLLQQGRALFIEKPLGLNLHQARALTWLAERHDCLTQVGFQRRCCPLLVKLRDECLARGPLTHVVCRFYKCDARPFVGPRDHLLDDSVHGLDTLRWLGGEVVAIHSQCRRVGTPDINFVAALLEFDTGVTGVLLNSWTSGRRIFDVELHAPAICAEIDLEGLGTVYADGDTTGVAWHTHDVAGSDQFYIHGGFRAKHAAFAAQLIAGQPGGSCFRDALRTMELAERILAQDLLHG